MLYLFTRNAVCTHRVKTLEKWNMPFLTFSPPIPVLIAPKKWVLGLIEDSLSGKYCENRHFTGLSERSAG